ncbi:hypothetical protein [Nonomuraea sp. NPDC049400]|uniref:hypothetical protein n=1 Tax=Nonomuraea sp. NPDC049400 TaxID=3364352 RepID=UPI0037AD7856
MADLYDRFLQKVRRTGSPDKAMRIMGLSATEIRNLLHDRPDLRQEIHDAVAEYRRLIVEGVIRTGTKMPGKLEWVSRNHGASLEEVRAWAKAFPDLAPLMEDLGALHDERVAARKDKAQAQAGRDRARARQDKKRKQQAARGMSLLNLEKRLAQAADRSYEGPESVVTLAEAWKVGATAADLSVHAIGCKWIGQQGMIEDRFHIHRLMPESELVEMAKHAEIDERCLCRRPSQEKMFAESAPRPSPQKPRTPPTSAQSPPLTRYRPPPWSPSAS